MNLHVLAEQTLQEILRTQWAGEPLVVVDSPPGAGKTGVVERLALASRGLMHERCMVVTQTNQQAFDLARRLATGFRKHDFVLYASDDLRIPPHLLALPNLQVITDGAQLPDGPCIVLANASKWSWLPPTCPAFDLQIVDEAYQLSDAQFHLIAGFARRHVLVGDPGQIDPVIPVEVERWKSDPAGPHVSAPSAALARRPTLLRMQLPVSRRLPQDTVQFVQPAFYPGLPFVGLARQEDRALSLGVAGTTPLDAVVDRLAGGPSLAMVELPAQPVGEADEDLARTLVGLAERLFARGAVVRDGALEAGLSPEDVGIVCAHVSQVNLVRDLLPPSLQGVFVETANRFQGLERKVVLAYHPLSGRADVNQFHLDRGRLCVMLSRHRVNCVLVGRAGIEGQLRAYGPSGERALGIKRDPEFDGWRAHSHLLASLRTAGRVIQHGP